MRNRGKLRKKENRKTHEKKVESKEELIRNRREYEKLSEVLIKLKIRVSVSV